MTLPDALRIDTLELTDGEAERLRHPRTIGYPVEVRPPKNASLPATLDRLVRGLQDARSAWGGLVNASPVSAYEVRRVSGNLQFQVVLPTKRLERACRTQLGVDVPRISFASGATGLPVVEGDAIAGGFLTLSRRDWYPLATKFDTPPATSLAAALHGDAMQDTDFVVQVLFQPLAGRPLRQWWWRRRAYQRIGYLRKEKESLWHSRSPTPREKQQARAIETKAGASRFRVSIRMLAIGEPEYLRSRIRELAGAFSVYENPETGQQFTIEPVRPLREVALVRFARAVADREFRGWSRRFQASVPELAALVSLPDHDQRNIAYAQP